MPKRISLLFALCVSLMTPLGASQIGLLIMATGKYLPYAEQLISSAERHFCRNHEITYFVFTDAAGLSGKRGNVVYVHQKRLGWPYDTMQRGHVYLKHADLWRDHDYIFASDADMLFVDTVGDEILSERVATLHPGFLYQRGSYETDPESTASVRDGEGDYYFAGGFYGGRAVEFLQIVHTNAAHIDRDSAKGITAVWHDESHWNRYCIDYPPTLILSPSYCFPEDYEKIGLFYLADYPPKLVALAKNHAELRR